MMRKNCLDIDVGHFQVAAELAEHVHEGIGFRLLGHDGLSPVAADWASGQENSTEVLRVHSIAVNGPGPNGRQPTRNSRSAT